MRIPCGCVRQPRTCKFNLRNWESSPAPNLQTGWLVDCQSIADHFKNPSSKKCNDRNGVGGLTAVVMAASWPYDPGRFAPRALWPERCGQIHWIDISCMTCDPLMKRMDTSSSDSIIKPARMDLKPTDASVVDKMMKQQAFCCGCVEHADRRHQ